MLIQAENLSKIYETGDSKVHALSNVSFQVERGEFVAVVGTSGSGKSTLLHLLGGLDRPTSGKVFIDGVDIYHMPPDVLTVFRRRYIGFVFQSYNLIPYLTVYENVALPLSLDGIRANSAEINELLHTLGIFDKRNMIPSRLSGGQQQRAAIARAVATKPHILLADEPTGNLDSRTGLEVMLLLKKCNEELAQTIIMITHNEELAQMATRRIRIEDGKITLDAGLLSTGIQNEDSKIALDAGLLSTGIQNEDSKIALDAGLLSTGIQNEDGKIAFGTGAPSTGSRVMKQEEVK